MKHWRKMYGVPIVRVVLICSLLVAALTGASAGPYSDLDAKLKQAKTPAEKTQVLQGADFPDDSQMASLIDRVSYDPGALKDATEYVDLKAMAESAKTPADQSKQIAKIKSEAVYHEDPQKHSANWLSGAIKRLPNLFPQREPGHLSSGPDLGDWGAFGIFLIRLVWFLLGAAVLAFIIYAIRFAYLGKMKKRRARAILEEDEPERTLDEWLAMANDLESQGKYREAVRALYLSCLLKFDERNIARFIRSQTNWEHLARIDASPRRPADLDFRSPTQAFDRIWYGYKVRGPQDVEDFRVWYRTISAALLEAAA